jgi:hypothetical protein
VADERERRKASDEPEVEAHRMRLHPDEPADEADKDDDDDQPDVEAHRHMSK